MQPWIIASLSSTIARRSLEIRIPPPLRTWSTSAKHSLWHSHLHSLSQRLTLASLSEAVPSAEEATRRGKGDRLILRGMRFHGSHGVFEEERKLGQKFSVDVDAWMDLREAGKTDQLEHSVSYADMYRKVKAVVEGPPHLLLESVATAIATDLFKHYPKISDVRIRVGKPHVAVEGIVDMLGVEIFRSSSQVSDHITSK